MRACLPLLLSLVATPAVAAEPIAGTWLTDTRDGIVQIARCGAAHCGRLVKLLRKVEGPGTDRNNPDAKLRGRPLVGLPILTGFTPDGEGWKGKAYDPKVGKTYASTLKRVDTGTLEVTGCVMFFCRTVSWTRVN
jgi:uncharacterized protein (DUF2147 family)